MIKAEADFFFLIKKLKDDNKINMTSVLGGTEWFRVRTEDIEEIKSAVNTVANRYLIKTT